jgi:hypothetical protein
MLEGNMRRFATIWLALVMALAAGHAIPSTVDASNRPAAVSIVWLAIDRDHSDAEAPQPSRKIAARKSTPRFARSSATQIRQQFLGFSLFQRPPPQSVSV